MPPMTQRGALIAACLAVAVLALAGGASSASALSGSPLKVAEPVRFEKLAVAVDSSGTAYVAWRNETDLGGKGNTVEYCVIPAGASGCAHSGTLVPEGAKEPIVAQVQALVDGSTVVILAEVYGVGEEYEPIQEWQSTDGGATFAAVDGGKSIADSLLNADSADIGAMIVPGSGELGYATVTAGGLPTFNAFPLSSPPQCSQKARCAYATLQPEGPNPLGNPGGSFASELAPTPGVLGVYETLGKPGCASGSFDTAFVYGSGDQSATNSYNISPGEEHSAWKVALSPGDCEAEYATVGGGPSGLGVVEKNLAAGDEIYHKFNQTTESFEPSASTIAAEGGLFPSVSQDGAGGVYVTYLGNANTAIDLAYSATGGASWTGPAVLNPNTDLGASDLVSSVGSNGQGWAVWHDHESVYAQQFDAADATVAATSGPAPPPPPKPPVPDSVFSIESIVAHSDGIVTITLVPVQSGKATLIVTVPTTVLALAAKSHCKHGQVRIKGRCRPATTQVGKTSANGTAGVPLKLTVSLSGKVKGLLKKGKTVHLTAKLTYASSLGGSPTTKTYSLIAKGKKPKHH